MENSSNALLKYKYGEINEENRNLEITSRREYPNNVLDQVKLYFGSL